jgi:uncharacterized repeat protein (TIGR01451 family)
VKDLLPTSFTYVSDNSLGKYNVGTGIWDVGTLPKGTSQTLTITTTLNTSVLVTNQAEVYQSDQIDPDSVPNNGSKKEDDYASAPSADLSLTQSVNNLNPDVGTNIIFTITVSNAGPGGTTNVTVKDLLPSGLTYVSYTGTPGTTYSSSTGIWTIGSMSNGSSMTLNITAKVTTSGIKTNWAEVWASDESDPDSIPGNGSTTEDDDASATIIPISVPTPTRTPTPIRTSTPTYTPTLRPTYTFIPPVGRPIINELLPRPGFDWNQDGKVNTFDEFIEIKNIGNADIGLSGWTLDVLGSSRYSLPAVTLKVGQRMVFYGLQTNLLLRDGGDTVRLISPIGKIYAAYTYAIAKVEDRSVCRLPDGYGSWYEDCIPTPNLINTRQGVVPSMPGGKAFESPVCDLPDSLPAAFLFAECRGYGANIWHSFYWDQFGWQGDQYIPANMSKWESFVQ